MRPHVFERNPSSNLITERVLNVFGDGLRLHHAFSRQALSKDKFEFTLETALNRGGFSAKLEKNRTNPGRDITVNGVHMSLKTEAAANIRENLYHISKFMELGKGAWDISVQRDKFFAHMSQYSRILQFRCIVQGPDKYHYQLIEIPKSLLEESLSADIEICEDSEQTPKPAYVRVLDSDGTEKFALYFDGGTERKLQIKRIKQKYCIFHASWKFDSATF
jgi:type II restriction enzyme